MEYLLNQSRLNTASAEPSHWTQECRKRIETFESTQQKARQFETYFENFLYYQQQQPANAAQLAEFKRYLSDYKSCWISCHAVDPKAMLTMFQEMECSLMQTKDELAMVLTKWKNDQALAQIGKPSNAHELQPIAVKFSKLDNTVCDAIGLVKRFQRFVEERLQHSHVTEMGPLWQETRQECIHISSRMAGFRRELQRESFLPFEQPPYIVRRFAGKTKSADVGDDVDLGSGEEEIDQGFDDGQSESKMQKQQPAAKSRGQPCDTNNNCGDKKKARNPSNPKDNKREQKVLFDLRVRLMVGDKSQIGDYTKVHAVLLTDQQCRELQHRKLSAYDDPLVSLSEIGPPLTAACATNKTAAKRKIAAARRRTPCLPGIPPFAAGQLTPHDACLTYDSTLEHFEAYFQNMKVNEKDRNPEADAQARFYRILFVTKLLDADAKHFYVWCLSVPFPIVVNATRQERATSAKIFCRLALAAINDPLETSQPSRIQTPASCASVPPHCPSVGSTISDHRFMNWTDFFDRLNWWWLKQTGAEMSLHAHELYLAWKLGVNLGSPDGACVTLEQVTRKYDGLDFSFWDWLFLIADYVKRNKRYWDSGFILAFVSKEQINSYLARIKEPVMFIRFSDSVLGSLVISYGQAGKEPQHIILHQKAELKQHRLTFFIQQSKQLLSVNYIATSLNPAVALKSKGEFFKLDDVASSPLDDDEEAMSRRGYTKPRLAFDWSEPPPQFNYEEQDDASSPSSSVTLEEVLRTELVFDNEFASFGYDDLVADPNGFSAALEQSPANQQAVHNWNANYGLTSHGSPSGSNYSNL